MTFCGTKQHPVMLCPFMSLSIQTREINNSDLKAKLLNHSPSCHQSPPPETSFLPTSPPVLIKNIRKV